MIPAAFDANPATPGFGRPGSGRPKWGRPGSTGTDTKRWSTSPWKSGGPGGSLRSTPATLSHGLELLRLLTASKGESA